MLGRGNSVARGLVRRLTQQAGAGGGQQTGGAQPPTAPKQPPSVPGLSSSVLKSASGPVGPNVDKDKAGPYKVPEYFCYHAMSYYEAEVEMSKFRLPQPSSC
ncbi:NADH:ubiquinone oxidoreductase subunit V3 [Arctopsyche grandis]|uniref:NADH:ubiquinone oxidoreductase subunit V3 n=1 Tax=Arctopsyche grandis TaxID=121162 RepID=UPI00406D659E